MGNFDLLDRSFVGTLCSCPLFYWLIFAFLRFLVVQLGGVAPAQYKLLKTKCKVKLKAHI